MKRFLIFIGMVIMALNISAQRTAILVAQFGTSNTEGMKAAPETVLQEIKESHPEAEVREAYTSPTIRRILDKRGIHKESVTDALLHLHLDGYERVFVQPTFLLDGIEMDILRKEVNQVVAFFQEVKVGCPLLYQIDDFKKLVSILGTEHPAQKGEAVVYVGHGNNQASTSTYSMIANMLHAAGQGQAFVGTVEGWPDLEQSVNQLAGHKFKKVILVPLLLSCGVHTHEDIDGEWKPALEKAGYAVEVYFHGLGENPAIREMILQHLNTLMN